MKKTNVYFIGECIIIVLLLLVIGILIKDKSNTTMGKGVGTQERNAVVVGEEGFSQSRIEEEVKAENTVEGEGHAHLRDRPRLCHHRLRPH